MTPCSIVSNLKRKNVINLLEFGSYCRELKSIYKDAYTILLADNLKQLLILSIFFVVTMIIVTMNKL